MKESAIIKSLVREQERAQRLSEELTEILDRVRERNENGIRFPANGPASLGAMKDDLKFLQKQNTKLQETELRLRETLRGLHDYLGEVTDLLVKHGLTSQLGLTRVKKVYPKKLMRKFQAEEEAAGKPLGELKAATLS